MNNRSSVYIGV